MTNQSKLIATLFQKRVSLVGRISEANADYLRLLQLSRGNDILLMKEPDSAEAIENEKENNLKTAACSAFINELETCLDKVDRDIESALAEDKKE